MANRHDLPKAEHTPHIEQPSTHKTLANLLNVGPGFPVSAEKPLAELAKILEPYEDFASAFGTGDISEKMALFEILEQDGVFSKEFMEKFASIGTLMHLQGHEKRTISDPGALRPEVVSTQARYSRDLDRASKSIHHRLKEDKRPLATSIMGEALHHSFLLSLEFNIRARGFQKVLAENTGNSPASPVERTHAMRYLNWIHYALAARKLFPKLSGENADGFTVDEKFSLLRDAEFLPSPELTMKLPILAEGKPITLSVSIPEKAHTLTLADFAIRDGNIVIRGNISRIDGELHLKGNLFFSLQEVFRFSGAKEHYEFLKKVLILSIFRAWQNGTLKEREYLESDTPPEQTESSPALDIPPNVLAEEPRTPENLAATTEQEKKKLKEIPRGKITWRRVMRAFKRFGITIDKSHAHPKLFFNGKTSGYLNSHDTDVRHNRQVLFDTLEELEIDRAEFMKKLY